MEAWKALTCLWWIQYVDSCDCIFMLGIVAYTCTIANQVGVIDLVRMITNHLRIRFDNHT